MVIVSILRAAWNIRESAKYRRYGRIRSRCPEELQAKRFGATAGVNGVVLTKLDGTAKGGVILAIAEGLGLPVRWVGVGEAADDLLPFDAEEFVDALLELSP